MTPPAEDDRRTTFTRVGAWLWIVAAIGYFVAEAVAAAAMVSTYSYTTDYISTLGAPDRSPLAVLMNAAFVIQAILFPAGAALLVAGGRARKASVVLAFAVINGVGNLLVASVHSGPHGSGPDWHGVGALLAIAGGNVAVLVGSSSFRRAGASRTYRAVSVALGALGLLCLVALQIRAAHTVLPIGIWERGSVYSIYAWQTVTAVYLLRRRAEWS